MTPGLSPLTILHSEWPKLYFLNGYGKVGSFGAIVRKILKTNVNESKSWNIIILVQNCLADEKIF